MPIRISLSAVRSNKHRAPSKKIRQKLDKYTGDFMLSVLSEVVYYPPVPAGSRYVRTMDLLRSWKIANVSSGNGVRWEIRNWRPYASLVHGPGTRQWRVHASHNWKNIETVMTQIGGRDRFRSGAQAIIDGNLDGY